LYTPRIKKKREVVIPVEWQGSSLGEDWGPKTGGKRILTRKKKEDDERWVMEKETRIKERYAWLVIN